VSTKESSPQFVRIESETKHSNRQISIYQSSPRRSLLAGIAARCSLQKGTRS
jgi:hypothetical protein